MLRRLTHLTHSRYKITQSLPLSPHTTRPKLPRWLRTSKTDLQLNLFIAMTIAQPMVETAAEAASHERPPAPLSKGSFRAQRPDIVGPDEPQPPFPIILSGAVQQGFGRGGKDLGCPTGMSINMATIYPVLIIALSKSAGRVAACYELRHANRRVLWIRSGGYYEGWQLRQGPVGEGRCSASDGHEFGLESILQK